jgi:hypothetical protein
VDWYKSGGFLPSSYSLIGAGENGVPEILGTVGGKSAVAGGAEITGIREAVENSSNAEVALLRQQNALLQALLEKETSISVSDVGKASRKYAQDYFNRTGREAYSF